MPNDGDIRQIVTVSDLNRLPVRVYLFAIINHLESLLSDVILRSLPVDAWLERMPDSQRIAVLELFEKKRREDLDTRLIDCTTLTHKFGIIARDGNLRGLFNARTTSEFRRNVKPIGDLRNRLAHGQDPVDESAQEDLGGNYAAEAAEMEAVRDNLLHASRISRRRDPAWLAGVDVAVHRLIDKAVG